MMTILFIAMLISALIFITAGFVFACATISILEEDTKEYDEKYR